MLVQRKSEMHARCGNRRYCKRIESPYYTISGKTGTAQVADKGIRYTDGVYQGSFVGYMPAEQPKYTICVVIRTKPHSAAYYGGAIAAPVFRMVADKIFSENIGAWGGPLDSLAKNSSGLCLQKRLLQGIMRSCCSMQ